MYAILHVKFVRVCLYVSFSLFSSSSPCLQSDLSSSDESTTGSIESSCRDSLGQVLHCCSETFGDLHNLPLWSDGVGVPLTCGADYCTRNLQAHNWCLRSPVCITATLWEPVNSPDPQPCHSNHMQMTFVCDVSSG